MNGRCSRFEGLLLVHDEGKNLILHLDRLEGVPCLIGGFGGHRGHLLPFMAAVGIEQLGLDPSRIGPVEGGSGCAPRDHRPNAWHLLRLPGIDAQDPGMGMGTSKDGPIEHVRQRGVRRDRPLNRSPARRHRHGAGVSRRPPSSSRLIGL